MDVIDTPIVRQSKNWLYARTSDYDPYFMQADILEFFTKWLPPWSKGHNHLFGPGGRLNKKDGLTRYGDSHVKDKTS